MNNKKLLLIFLALLIIYGLSQLFSGKKDRSFNTDLIKLDTAKVTRIVVWPKADDFVEVVLTREDNGWLISKGDIHTKAMQNNVNSILNQLTLIETKRIAAKNPEKWNEYEVEEGNGTRLQVYGDGKLLKDFIVGRFSFNQQSRQATSFIRLTGEEEVYAVDGFLGMNLGQGFDSYRNKQILKLNRDDINAMIFSEGDSSFTISKIGNDWTINESQPLDSTKMANFLSNLQNINGTDFADYFDPVEAAGRIVKSLTVYANNQTEPLIVHCYTDTTREKPFIIHSSQNREGYFESDSTGVYDRIFVRVNDVLGSKEDE